MTNRCTALSLVGALLAVSVAAGCGTSSAGKPGANAGAPGSAASSIAQSSGSAESNPPAMATRPFVEPWSTPVPDDAPVGPEGTAYGQELAREISKGYGQASLNTYRYAPAVYAVPEGQPTVAVEMWNCQHKAKLDAGLISQLSAVPLPADAVIPADSDAHVAVWQPSTDTVWEMWKTRVIDGHWQACWGGRLDHASQSTGTFEFPYGPTASGMSLQAGLLTLDDLAAGHIDHALAMGVANTRKGQFSWPANRTDGKSTDQSSIPEGQRLRLDPALDLSTLSLSPLGRMVAEALQRYGAIVRDTTVGAVTVYAGYPTARGKADPYAAYYGNQPKYAQLDGIPWERMQALPLNFGKP